MGKLLVKVYVPNLEKSYEVWIPAQRRIYNIIKLLVEAINDLNNNGYRLSTFPMLYNKNTAEMYDLNAIVSETTMKNGIELILI